jgi:hypothetical protein
LRIKLKEEQYTNWIEEQQVRHWRFYNRNRVEDLAAIDTGQCTASVAVSQSGASLASLSTFSCEEVCMR